LPFFAFVVVVVVVVAGVHFWWLSFPRDAVNDGECKVYSVSRGGLWTVLMRGFGGPETGGTMGSVASKTSRFLFVNGIGCREEVFSETQGPLTARRCSITIGNYPIL
jgi:hypothetical protein